MRFKSAEGRKEDCAEEGRDDINTQLKGGEKTNNKKVILGIVLSILVLFVPTVNAASVYFEPQHMNAETGNYDEAILWVDIVAGETLGSGQFAMRVDTDHAYLKSAKLDCVEEHGETCWGNFWKNTGHRENGSMWCGMADAQVWDDSEDDWVSPDDNVWFTGPAHVKICKFKIEPDGTSGESPFNFEFLMRPDHCYACQPCMVNGQGGITLTNVTWRNGTFTHIGVPETFEKELVLGWNLISLPLMPVNNSTNAVLENDTFEYNAVYIYNATTNLFECPSTMDPGIGYFVHVTTAGTWNYTGTPYTSMNIGLKEGLNCIGWTNTSEDLPDAMDSIPGNCSYVARWNVSDPKYEVYDANAPAGMPEFIEFTAMARGNGYWIVAKEDCTLSV